MNKIDQLREKITTRPSLWTISFIGNHKHLQGGKEYTAFQEPIETTNRHNMRKDISSLTLRHNQNFTYVIRTENTSIYKNVLLCSIVAYVTNNNGNNVASI